MSLINAKDFLTKMQHDSDFRERMQSLSEDERITELKVIGLDFSNEEVEKAKEDLGLEEADDVVGQSRASGCSCYTWRSS